jgi:hypothetical protein
MSLNTPEPVVSSERYVVIQLDGRRPVDPSDFVGPISALIERNGKTHQVTGRGGEVDGAVRIYEKDSGPDGKDVRVWDLTKEDDGTFSVTHGGPR